MLFRNELATSASEHEYGISGTKTRKLADIGSGMFRAYTSNTCTRALKHRPGYHKVSEGEQASFSARGRKGVKRSRANSIPLELARDSSRSFAMAT